MKKSNSFSLLFRTALLFGLLLLIVLAGRERQETIVDNRPPPRYRVTFTEPLETGEAKELLRKYDVSLLHITYVAPGFSGNGLVRISSALKTWRRTLFALGTVMPQTDLSPKKSGRAPGVY